MKVKIKEVAKANGISIEELASRMQVSRQTIHYYCQQGDKNPLAQLEKIANAIGVSVSELFEKQESFWAVIREKDVTRTFESKESLSKWLFGEE